MIKKIIATSFVTALLLFSGCANDDGESRLEIQQMLDDGDYQGVIDKLDGTASTEDQYLALAAAYTGRAGLGFADLVSIMTDTTDATSESGFADFAQQLSESVSDTALSDLGKATDYYKMVVGDSCEGSDENLTNSTKDVCLFIGLNSTMKAATTLSYLGDLANFGSDVVDGGDNELTASACAMGYAYNGDAGTCTITEEGNVTFVSGNTYTNLKVTANGEDFYYLMTINEEPFDQTIITDGYCDVNYTTADCDQNATVPPSGCYVCPVNQDANETELTVATILVDVLNDGLDSVLATVGVDNDIADSVDEYKAEVADADGNITVESIIDYINSQNL